ncbi:hypothetical protein I79_015342 [Cricetulus griseus]|uniref:Uncharacterized protein n=1 Tax=Cricetulus griseus TaxID=10029 RepID=G3HWL1_CRIGR|nr:hypothetical protein I79_015342 [Cricetulus griseus]
MQTLYPWRQDNTAGSSCLKTWGQKMMEEVSSAPFCFPIRDLEEVLGAVVQSLDVRAGLPG